MSPVACDYVVQETEYLRVVVVARESRLRVCGYPTLRPLRREGVDRRMAVGSVALQYGGWEVWVIRRIGEMLGFQAKRRPFGVGLSALAWMLPSKKLPE